MLVEKESRKNHSGNITTLLIFLFIAVAAFILTSCASSGPKEEFIPTINQIKQTYNFYKDAESFKYAASYGLVQAGNLTVESEDKIYQIDNFPCYRVKMHGQLKAGAGMVNINDFWESYIDTASLLTYKASRMVQENKYRKYEYSFFKREENKVILTDTTNKNNIKTKICPAAPGIHDMSSAFFVLRNMPFDEIKEGDTITIDAFIDDAPLNIKIKYLGKEKIKTKFGKLNTITIAPIVSNSGALSGSTPIKAWLSDDELKVPLKVQIKLVVGSAELELEEYRNKKGNGFSKKKK